MIVNNRLPNSLPFLMSRIVAKLMEQCREYYDMGLSVPEARALIVVLENPGIRVGRLAEMTSIELSTLSHMLGRLAQSGLITRVRPETDSRSVTIGLTAVGRTTALKCEAASIRHEELLLQGLDPGEVKIIRRIIRKIADNVSESGRATTDDGKAAPIAKKSTRTMMKGSVATPTSAAKKAMGIWRSRIRQAR